MQRQAYPHEHWAAFAVIRGTRLVRVLRVGSLPIAKFGTAWSQYLVMNRSAATISLAVPGAATRWTQLLLGLICMMAISSPQYVWTLFTKPIGTTLGVTPAALQVTFSLLIVLQTFFSPFQGWLVDRFGPRRLIAVGGVLSGLSWMLASQASSLAMLYLTYGIVGGLGTGIVYVGVVGQMVGWFPDRRGFAAGVVAAG